MYIFNKIKQSKIGLRKFSKVFLVLNSLNNQAWGVKILKPIKESKIKREIKIYQDLCLGLNIINQLDNVRYLDLETTALVFEYVNNVYYR